MDNEIKKLSFDDLEGVSGGAGLKDTYNVLKQHGDVTVICTMVLEGKSKMQMCEYIRGKMVEYGLEDDPSLALDLIGFCCFSIVDECPSCGGTKGSLGNCIRCGIPMVKVIRVK